MCQAVLRAFHTIPRAHMPIVSPLYTDVDTETQRGRVAAQLVGAVLTPLASEPEFPVPTLPWSNHLPSPQ